ncbi:MAG: SpoIIE family protein phosphatase [Clostridiales bacterium]|nr:SpoIIE family protein phosphatase [Clostridiales bacterium]
MKKTNAKQMILGVLGSFVCGGSIMGCYPLVPAYFAALYLEHVSGLLLLGFMYIGMLFFMPLTAAVKYGVVLLVIAGAIRLVEWAQEGCPAFLAGILAAVSTLILSFCGSLLEWKNQPDTAAVFLETLFIFGAVVLLNRIFHGLMEYRPPESIPEKTKERGNEERLMNYAESFQGLSHIFYTMSQKKNRYTAEELGQIQNELTGKMCTSCESCAICWERDATPLYGILSEIISSIWHAGVPGEEQEKELSHYCPKSRDMVEEAVHVFERVNLNRAWYNRLLENRQVIAEQLDAMAYIMKDCAREEKVLDREERGALAEIRYRAKEHGIVIEDMHLIETVEGKLKLESSLRSRMGGCISMKTFAAAVSRALDKKMRLPADTKTFISKEAAEFVLYEDTLYRNVQGIARLKKDGAKISGDNFSFLELERGDLVLGLSDGMGSGSSACKESEMVLDLLERFLEAGFSVETAIRMMNSAMVMRGDNDLYSTVDLCKVNLYTGMADFYKIGAAATFIKRADEVECITSSSLPVGVETQFEIEKEQRKLENGDFVVMVTDGVLEYLHVPKPEETMQEIIEGIQTNNPGILAKRIMERVMLFTGGKAADDMTVLTTCIWEK